MAPIHVVFVRDRGLEVSILAIDELEAFISHVPAVLGVLSSALGSVAVVHQLFGCRGSCVVAR